MTTQQPAKSQPAAAARPILADGVHGIDRTGRLEPAGRREQRRNKPLVKTEEVQQKRSRHRGLISSLMRRIADSRSLAKSEKVASRAAALTLTTKSND